MAELRLLTQGQHAFDDRAWAEIEVRKPVIALIGRRRHLSILLAKDSSCERGGTTLSGVRWVRLPMGWRRWALERLCEHVTLHLPDEWLFVRLFLGLAPNGTFVARLNPDPWHPLVLPEPSEWPYPVKPLSAGQYSLLDNSRGRLLHAQVLTLFREHLGLEGERACLQSPPNHPAGPPPWTVFAG
jgi:hypothetical protein